GKEQVAVPLRANVTLAPNVPPVFDSTWVAEELYHNQLVQMDLTSRVSDADGSITKYMMQYDASRLQAVVSNDGMLTMVGLKVGATNLRISVIDNDLDTSSHNLVVRVLNHLPTARMLLDTVQITNAALTVSLAAYFEDQN